MMCVSMSLITSYICYLAVTSTTFSVTSSYVIVPSSVHFGTFTFSTLWPNILPVTHCSTPLSGSFKAAN